MLSFPAGKHTSELSSFVDLFQVSKLFLRYNFTKHRAFRVVDQSFFELGSFFRMDLTMVTQRPDQILFTSDGFLAVVDDFSNIMQYVGGQAPAVSGAEVQLLIFVCLVFRCRR